MSETVNEVTALEVVSNEALYLLTKAEIDTQVATAKAFPRNVRECLAAAMDLATINEDVAESCCYAVPRQKKNKQTNQWETVFIEGPSVRLAEILTYAFGNTRSGSRVIANDGRTITSQGICHDLERNNCRTLEVQRSIFSNGKTYSQDMQVVTGNAAGAIAYRNAVFSVIPAALIESVYNKAKEMSKGTLASLKEKREKALRYFNDQGVDNDRVCALLEVKGVDEINLEKLSILRGLVTLVKNGEGTIKDLFDKKPEVDTAAATDKAKEVQEDLQRVIRNKPKREQIKKLQAEQEGLDPQDAKYLTLAEKIEALEKTLEKISAQ